MIITKEIEIKINSTALKHYKDLGYDVKLNDIIKVDVNHLTKGSFYKIKVKCDICGFEKELRYNRYIKNTENSGIYCCSNKCAHEVKNKVTCLEKYGVENYRNIEKFKKTCLEKYGFEYASQSNEIKEKIKKVSIEKYGTESPNSSVIVKENKKKSLLEKYGVDHYSKTDEYKNKLKETCLEKFGVEYFNNHKKYKETCLEKYGVEHLSNIQLNRDKIKDTNRKTSKIKLIEHYKNRGINIINVDFENKQYKIFCNKCQKEYNIDYNLLKMRLKHDTITCIFCNPIGRQISGLEIKLYDFIKDNYKGRIIKSSKNIINPYEIDIYLPELKIAFEFNGEFWHDKNHRDKNYHQMKTNLCNEKGIRLIHIWEHDWSNNQEIIKSIILENINIYKHKIDHCSIIEIKDENIIADFLNENHLKGYVKCKVNIGLIYDNELISMLSINNSEIIRYCNKLNTVVVKGFIKMLHYYIENYFVDKITFSADRCYENKLFFEELGFECVGITEPNLIGKTYDSGNLKLIYNKN